MSFDPHSLERLRELSRQLPKSTKSKNQPLSSNKRSKPKLHSIETEENPQKLFQELIKASPDGTIPKHLLARLKQVEAQAFNEVSTTEINLEESSTDPRDSTISQSLYTSFQRLLLEEEE